MTNARIIRGQPWVPNVLDPEAATFPPMEEISIVYQEITVTDEIANTTVTISVGPES